MKISASFLSIKDDLKNNILLLDKTNIDYLHLDIMDGVFVPNTTWTSKEINYLIDGITKPLDIHLMVKDVKKYINDFSLFNPTFITFHYEAIDDIMEIINMVKSKKIKVGISIKPETDVSQILEYLPFVDLVLVMSVEPGKGGQSFIKKSKNKIKQLKDLKIDNNFKYLIEVDGGINNKTLKDINEADIIVIGSYITSGDYKEKVNKIYKEVNNG